MGLGGAALEHVMMHTHVNKSSHKPLTHIPPTINKFTIDHVYRYATLLLGFRVCLGGVRIDKYLGFSVTFVGGCVTDGR